ncbi:MAG: Gfo/Idh/MocA family oxidoreductase, partial [Desulfamplus sp.]|nr:Gfo/Idh/MocA family oxidoreductase [Desulfamplus sp.]
IGKAILDKKIHCLMVKPLAPTIDEAIELVKLQEKGGVYAAIEFHKRFDESNRIAKRLIIDGSIGSISYMTIDYSQRIMIPLEIFREWSTKTHIFQYLGVHYVDLVFFLTGAHPKRVMAIGTRGVLDALGVSNHDSVHAIIQWHGGTVGEGQFITLMNIGWIDPNCTSALSDQRVSIVGSRGRLELDQKKRGIELVNDSKGTQQINPYFADYLPTINGGMEFQGYGYKSIRGFLDDVQSLKAGRISLAELNATRPSFQQGLISTSVVEAVNTSLLQSSRWVDIHDLS